MKPVLNMKVVQKKRCPRVSHEELQMKPDILQNILEIILFALNRVYGMMKQMKKQLLGGNLMKTIMAKY